ncbi:RHS repeat-associated core domain-containing protein [Pseudomonas sp. Pseusp122]|uniref:RHS repeat-associated core domain-containing protein n=1 Tax=unclassified Pseudomonas TaxID=196821 RepID=UPI0039A54CC3
MTIEHTVFYRYDPLDRLAACSPAAGDSTQRFYQKNRLTTEIQGQIQRAFFQTEDQLFAQHQGPDGCILLASDQQRSVLDAINGTQRQSASYTPYGARHPQANPLGLLGFTGERADPVTGHYLLGNGYRAFNPTLMRFNSPDSLSPFGEGGLNAFAYCGGDPVNRIDSTGHIWQIFKPALRSLGLIKKSSPSPSRRPSSSSGSDLRAALRDISEAEPVQPDSGSITRFDVERSARSAVARNMKLVIRAQRQTDSLFTRAVMATPPDQLTAQLEKIPNAHLRSKISETINSTQYRHLEKKLQGPELNTKVFDNFLDDYTLREAYFNHQWDTAPYASTKPLLNIITAISRIRED